MTKTELTKGGNAPLTGGEVAVDLRYAGGSLDVSALLLGADGRVRSDEDMVFFNQPAAEGGAVRLDGGTRITLRPGSLPPAVERIVIVASCDPGDPARTFAEVKDLTAVAGDVTFAVPPMAEGERAAVLLEFYRRGEAWKVRAVGQGYAAGLAGLATDFGITVDDPGDDPGDEPAVEPVTAPAPAPAQPARANLVKAPLGDVSLEKSGRATISLDKEDRELVVTASLVWDGGSDGRRVRGADLDLYALFVPAARALRGPVAAGTIVPSGHTPQGEPVAASRWSKGQAPDGVVYYRELGSLTKDPFILLDGDSRVPGQETVRIVRPDTQGYVLLCAYSALSNGFGSFKSFGAHVVVTDGRGSTVTVPLFEKTRTRYWVAIALVDFTEPEGAAIRHVEAYSARMTERRPVLHDDGTIAMNAGPVEFKRN